MGLVIRTVNTVCKRPPQSSHDAQLTPLSVLVLAQLS